MPILIVTFLAALGVIGFVYGIANFGQVGGAIAAYSVMTAGNVLYALLAIIVLIAVVIVCFVILKNQIGHRKK